VNVVPLRFTEMFHFECVDKFRARFADELKNAKAIFNHLKLYVGLLIYTAVGAFVSQVKIQGVPKVNVKIIKKLFVVNNILFCIFISNNFTEDLSIHYLSL
jgi:hypothetical protein